MVQPLSDTEDSSGWSAQSSSQPFGAVGKTPTKTGCIYNAQGEVKCGLPVEAMVSTLNRSPHFPPREKRLRNMGAIASDAIHVREPEFTFTYNPDICCRKMCGHVAPCENVHDYLEKPRSLCSACQKGWCDRRC